MSQDKRCCYCGKNSSFGVSVAYYRWPDFIESPICSACMPHHREAVLVRPDPRDARITELTSERNALRVSLVKARESLIGARNALELRGNHPIHCSKYGGDPCDCGLADDIAIANTAIAALPKVT